MNILIGVKGKDCNLPDIAIDQMTKSVVVLAKKASASQIVNTDMMLS